MYEVRTFLNIKLFETKEQIVDFYWSNFYDGDHNIRVIDCYDRQIIDNDELYQIYYAKRKAYAEQYGTQRYGHYTFRDGPVQGTGKRRWKGGGRHPRTKQELSQEKPTRAKRNHLPTTWDDLWRFTEKNWKSQRKTQYKSVAISTEID